MRDRATTKVSKFYEDIGWKVENGFTEDAQRWEDLRPSARDYVSRCRLRVLRHIPSAGASLLDMASGPIQYPEYLEYSRNFSKRYCVDLSHTALELARLKIGEHGVFLQGNFLDMDFGDDFFDCCISLHTIYHIDADKQEGAVRKLLSCSKPEAPVIVVYSNPDRFRLANITHSRAARLLAYPWRSVRRAVKRRKSSGTRSTTEESDKDLYFHAHATDWWLRFADQASVEFRPWRSFDAATQKRYFPDNALGEWMFSILFWLEDKAPSFFARCGTYPLIILRKRAK